MGIVFRDWETRLVAGTRLVQTDLRYIELLRFFVAWAYERRHIAILPRQGIFCGSFPIFERTAD